MGGFKPEVKVVNEAAWHRNGLAFASKEEAEQNAFNLMMRWAAVEEYRAVWVEDAVVNYRWDNEKGLVALEGA